MVVTEWAGLPAMWVGPPVVLAVELLATTGSLAVVGVAVGVVIGRGDGSLLTLIFNLCK